MCLFKKQLKQINDSINELKSKEIDHLRQESKELEELKALLSKVRFSVKKAIPMEDGTVKIIYEIPTVLINGTERNEMVYAINMLDLISLEDMQKIQNAIDIIEK